MKGNAYRWWLLALLFVTFFLELGSRQLYNAALPQIKVDFAHLGITDTQLGVVGTVFSAVFGLCLVASGLVADLFGRKRVIVLGTALFSLAICASGFAGGIVALIVAYGVFNAMGQCCIAPPSYSLISQHHVETRATAMGIFQSAVYLGVVLGSMFAGVLAESGEGGWRIAFWLFGGVGVAWALVMAFTLRETPVAATAGEKATLKDAFLALVKKPTAIMIAVAFGFYTYASLGIRLWSAAFMVREFEGVGLARAAFHSVFWLNLGSFVGLMLTARFMDWAGANRPRIRLEVSAVGFLLCVLPVFWVARVTGFAECCVALAVLGLAVGVYEAAHYPAMFDCIAPRYRSAATGMTGAYAFFFGSLGPFVLGWMSEHLSMRAGLASLSVFFLLGALVLLPALRWTFKRDYIVEEGTGRP